MDERTFPCPGCRQIIDTTVQSCGFCGVAIDPAAAAMAAPLQEQVQKAWDQAGRIRRFAMAMPVVFLLSFVPTVAVLGRSATDVTLLFILVSLILWSKRFGKLESPDPDLSRARRAVRQALLVWVAMVVVNVAWYLFTRSLGFDPRL
ncbi:MAG TPA: hypothetical protein VHB47_00040 [Thermoanaerobaculia bacterium]|jgi:hypothetical protein|nr:hypothetical protein [Thermoanaerobaculia bacterium]